MPLKLHNEVSTAFSLKNKTQGWWCPSVSSWGHSQAPVAAVTLVAHTEWHWLISWPCSASPPALLLPGPRGHLSRQ